MKRTELQHNLAMTVTLVMGAMLFATLFMGYAIYRSSAVTWPPLGIPRVSLTIPTLSSVFILLSSWFMYQCRILVLQNNCEAALKALIKVIILGAMFILSQGYFWFELKRTGVFLSSSGVFGSTLYGFTWIHALHVMVGMGSLFYLWFHLRGQKNHLELKALNVEKFWHFLGVVWFLMFLILFVL